LIVCWEGWVVAREDLRKKKGRVLFSSGERHTDAARKVCGKAGAGLKREV